MEAEQKRVAAKQDAEHSENELIKAHNLVVTQFESRIASLEKDVTQSRDEVNRLRDKHDNELTEVYKKLDECKSREAHSLVEQEKLRGDIRELRVYVDRLWAHEKEQKEQIKTNQEKIQELLLSGVKSTPGGPIEAAERAEASRGDSEAPPEADKGLHPDERQDRLPSE